MSQLDELAAALDKKRVSIDQCFLSTIVNGDPKSAKLGAALDAAHASGKIICPIHFDETLVESSFLPDAIRHKLFTLQNRLSNGYAFHSFDQSLRHHTLAMIRPGLLFPPLRAASLPLVGGPDFAAMAKTHRAGKDDYVDRMNRLPYPPSTYRPGMKGDEIFELVSAARSYSLYRILEALKSTSTLDTGREEWEYALAIGAFLADIGVGPHDLDVLIDKVQHHEWRAMPDLWAHTRINAQIELGYLGGVKKASANDLFDLSRIAVALNDADVLLCDTAMCEMIKQSKVQEILDDVKVFSMKQRDEAAEFIAAL